MTSKTMTYGVIGNGRMATHMVHYLGLLKLATVHITWPRQIFDNEKNQNRFKEIIEGCDIVLVLISDAALNDFILKMDILKPIVHFSGQLVLEQVPSAHPLMSFGPELYDLPSYQKIPFIIEAEGPDFEQLLPGFANPHFKIPRNQKAKYHALCVLAGNFSCLLWQKFFDDLQTDYKIPFEHLLPYFEQITHNIKTDYQNALTGPLKRGDQNTLDANMKALENDPYQAIYQSFVKLYEKI